MMRIMRLPLLPVAIVVELALLACGWILALISPARAGKLVKWADQHVPGLDWYLGREVVCQADSRPAKRLIEDTTMDELTDYEPFAGIIQRALAKRGSADSDLDRHPEYGTPKYIVRMCEALMQAINETGNHRTTLADVVRLESTCTGTDYHHKLAMRCQRLAIHNAA